MNGRFLGRPDNILPMYCRMQSAGQDEPPSWPRPLDSYIRTGSQRIFMRWVADSERSELGGLTRRSDGLRSALERVLDWLLETKSESV